MLFPPEHVTESLIRRLASLYHRLGNEIGNRPLVLPNGDFFPDTFAGDEESVVRLLRRMQLHAGLEDIPIEVKVIAPKCPDCDGSCSDHGAGGCGGNCKCGHEAGHATKGSCGTGTCGSCLPEEEPSTAEPRLVDVGDGWRLQIPAAELSHNVMLTANLAKSLGLVFLLDTRPPGQFFEESEIDIACECAAVALGFGGLLLQASYLYSKSCGGPKVAQMTRLSCGELAILTALFALRAGHKVRELRKLLGTTQVSALDEGVELFRSNPAIIEDLRSRPLDLSEGKFKLGPAGGLWQRWFKPKRHASNTDDLDLSRLESELALSASVPRRATTSRPDPMKDDLRNLVDEALSNVGHEG